MSQRGGQQVLCAWSTPSSQGTATYETVAYADGTSSCDCPGWTFQKKVAGLNRPRQCKHTKAWHARVKTIGMAQAAVERRAMFRSEMPRPIGRSSVTDWLNAGKPASEPEELPDGYRVIDLER